MAARSLAVLARQAGHAAPAAAMARRVSAFPRLGALPSVEHFGTPRQLSREFALGEQVEKGQPPGRRELADYFRLTPRMFSEPNPLQPHLLSSIWGTVYLDVWADICRESDVERALVAERENQRSTIGGGSWRGRV